MLGGTLWIRAMSESTGLVTVANKKTVSRFLTYWTYFALSHMFIQYWYFLLDIVEDTTLMPL